MKSSLNSIFHTIWSEALGAWVAVSELTKTKGKRTSSSVIRSIRPVGSELDSASDIGGRLKPIVFAVACCFAFNAQANPLGGQVVNGQATFNNTGNTLTVTNTPGTIINWQGFSINSNEVTHFAQQSAASSVLNRVITSNPSAILGTLSSNGRVFLVNPSGIFFGAGSTVDVAGLVATSLNLSNADFLAGRHNYTAVAGAQNVSNAGNINTQQNGQVYLIAPNVENTGIINAPYGEILLVAGHSVELVNDLDPNLRVNITAPAGDATNIGQLISSAGTLGIFGTVVRNSGVASADSATMQGGKIVFRSSQRTEVSGTVTANGTTGGTILALGNEVGIIDGATVSANGTQGGGTILVGGDYQGKNPDVQNAQVTYVAPTATISADAIQNGNGGRVIVWADDTARIYGSISATGGAEGGNGGFVETSGKRYLDVTATPNVSAPAGGGGRWLLDPRNVTIQAGPGTMDNIDVLAPYFIPAAIDNSTLDVALINAALNAETTIQVTTGSTGIQLGTITVAAPITKTTGTGIGTLTLIAANEILINADITASSGQIQFFTGATQVDVNANITLNGGAWDATGGGATVRVDSGAPIIDAPLNTGTVNISAGTATFNGNIFPTNLTVSGGTLTGSGVISIPNTGTLNWSNGVIGGSGTLTTQAGSTTTLAPGFNQTASLRDSRVWDNSGTVTFTPNVTGLSYFQIDDTLTGGTAVFNNQVGGVFNLNPPGSTNHTIGVGTFNNAGIFNKNVNVSSSFAPVFNNQATGVVNVTSGTLTFGGTGTDVAGSAYNVPIGSTLNFGAARTIAGSIAGAGTVGLYNSGGVVAIGISGSYNVSGATSVWADCCGNTTVSFTGPVTNIGTTFTGSASSTVDFSGITSGEATAFANLTSINSSSTLTLKTGTLLTGLSALTVGGGTLDMANSSLTLTTFDITGGTITGSGIIDVSGAFNWTGTSAITGSGTLNTLVGGTTALAPNFNQTTYLAGSRIWNNYGTVTFTPNVGTLSYFYIDDTLTGGTAVFNNMSGGVFNLNSSASDNNIKGVGTFNNAGTLNNNQNFISTFTPVFNNQATGVVNVTSGALLLNGIGTDVAGSAYNIANGAALQFGASRTMPGSIAGAGSMLFAGGTTTVSGSYNVSGQTSISGTTTANFTGAVTNVGSSLVANSGTTTLNFGGIASGEGTAFANLTSINSASTLTFKTGTLLTGLTALTVGGGTLDLVNSNLTLATLDVTGGTITGSGIIDVSGAFNWTGTSAIAGSGTLNTLVGGTTALAPNFNQTTYLVGSRIWNNYGTVTFTPSAGTLSHFQLDDTLTGGTAVFNNMSGGVFNLNSPVSDTHINGVGTFNNAGTLNKNLNFISTFAPDFNNQSTGVVNVTSGTLTIAGAFTQSGTINVAAGTTFSKAGGFSNSITGTLAGAGTISVGIGNSLGNNGTISPGMTGGDMTGTLSIVGNLSMGASSILNIDINSPLAGDYDVLSLTPGMAGNLDGTLNLFGVAPAGSYSIFSSTGGMFGTFATINAGTFTQTPTYDTGNQLVTLTVTANTLAGSMYWDGGASTFNWADALNWSTDVLPTATDNIYIASLGANSLLINSGTRLGNNLVCDANFQLAGGGLTLGGTAFFNGVSNSSSGTLSTAGATQMGTLNWTGGTITGAGVMAVSSLNMPAGTAVNGVNATNLNGKTMNVNGNTSFSSGVARGNSGADLTLLNGAIINNKGIWSIDNIANIFSGTGGGTFHNFGEVRVGQTVAATATISTVFNNDNSIFIDLVHGANITNGNLIISGGGTSIFDAFNTQVGTTIDFTNGYNFNGISNNFGLGDLKLSGNVTGASPLRAENIILYGAGSSSGTAGLEANNNILLQANSVLTSSAGVLNLTMISDADGIGGGGIYLDTGSSINSNGGNISMGGMPSVGRAKGNGTVTGGKTFNSGIYVLGDITAGAGNVTMRGEGNSADAADGITFAGGLLSSNGTVYIDGVAHGNHCCIGTNVSAGVDFLGALARLSTATGTVTITGLNDATNLAPRSQGITVESGTIIETTGSGTLTLNGTSRNLDTSWGVGIFGGTVRTTAVGGGAITLNGINATKPDGGVVISDGNVLSSGGEIRIIAAGLGGSGTIGTSTIGGVSSGNILIKANDSGPIGITSASSINAGSNSLTLILAGGPFNDNGSSITAGSLRLLGSGTFNLGGANYNVGVLAANVTSNVTYNDTNGFAIGSVTSFDGTAATTTAGVTTGNANFTGTTTGNITLNTGGVINAGAGSVVLAATGNFINNSGSITPITAASGKIYSTSPSSNTKGGMVPAFSIFNCTYLGACGAIPPTGIGYLYTQVTAPTLSIIADALSKVYGSSDPALTYAVSGLVGDDLASIMTGAQSRAAGENAGTYAISQGALSVPAGYGYTLSYTGNNLTITPALLTLNLSASNASKIYGTALTFAGTEFTPVGLISGDTITGVTLTSTGSINTANAGAYSIDITPGSEVFGQGLASNYNIINYIPGTLTVNPAPLTVSANVQSKVYGNIDPVLTYTSSGLLFADTLTGSLSRVAGENVGNYSINLGTLANPNYSISYTGNNLSISQRIISIIASASSKVYGSADPNLYTVGGSGLASWDSSTAFTGSLSHTGGENVVGSPYAITQGTLAANSNYSVSGFTGNNLTITPAPMVVAGVPVNKVLGTPDPQLTYTTSGLQFSDTEATVLNGGSLMRDPGDTIGSYLVNQGTLALLSTNYTMTYVPCNFTILAPTVVQEITQMTLQSAPTEDTATTSQEEEKKESAELLAEAAIMDDSGQPSVDPLPVCR